MLSIYNYSGKVTFNFKIKIIILSFVLILVFNVLFFFPKLESQVLYNCTWKCVEITLTSLEKWLYVSEIQFSIYCSAVDSVCTDQYICAVRIQSRLTTSTMLASSCDL